MVEKRYFPLLAGLGLVAASLVPTMVVHAQDTDHQQEKEGSETLARVIKPQVEAGMAEGAVGMEKGAEEMLRGAERMEAYADRLESDADFVNVKRPVKLVADIRISQHRNC
ncbi:hypothetical protein [Sphingorhabdus sp. 109]|uniref:hypothetical protein n=1 Tax=Sphingorhabdus sp. 109 TaxID=2653173 RepID=UPI0012F00AE2|nr:hypothetical protein [Sphingorhabdus sp. 109]VWX59204.1 conserved exported hypothetical protein [Sphingorhabdus sp. 109]